MDGVGAYRTYPIRSDVLTMTVKVDRCVESVQSPYQHIEVLDTKAYGRMLFLDGHVQLAQSDEGMYHEALVHVCGLNVASLRRALVIGGGDGGVIRELVKYPTIERIDIVEIDEEVIRVCLQHMPFVSNGAFDDSRVQLTIGDAFPFVKECQDRYELIVVDATDVYEEEDGSLSEMLFTEDFYRDLVRLLSPDGYVVTQADNPIYCPYSLEAIRTEFAKAFPKVGDYVALVPSFGGMSAYCWASQGAGLKDVDALDFGRVRLDFFSRSWYDFARSSVVDSLTKRAPK